MKIAVPTIDNTGRQVEIADKFGRAPYFAVIDKNQDTVDFISNSAQNAASGAGVQAVQLITDKGVEIVLAPNIGPKAFAGLEKAEITTYQTKQKILDQAVANYKADELTELKGATNQGHVGLN